MLPKEIQLEINKGAMLPLMEEFYTIQGEGSHTGRAAYFIRIGGCDVGCHWCDVKESWNAEIHPPTSVDLIVENAAKFADTVVVTGGEPLSWDMTLLTNKLKERNLKVHIETSGAFELSGTWDWICLSPKKNKLPTKTVYDNAHELKVIIHNKHDFIFAEEQAELVNDDAILFLQPEWSKKEEMTPLIVDYVMNNPKWRVSLQTHKYLNIP
ncbi:7-carboxy-7-deazaguanine synthase QueE [Flavobacterium sp. 17A]|uniref:7-carboxy-7-deazaguanine synthase n=1 Tax=Flavobacterium potami TaxID=2872310 RepID=A0A9X1HE52_9FLAO|nr:7-carboxy-7-deazaguanine synthase QueE [Flavobacterium potami]MBZ4037171.1 7-carboxy-7-deazaguanine synthase QueE [Flavobacterium potami]